MEEKQNIEIRALNKDEVKEASDLADLVYPKELYESLECFERKFDFYPQGFLGLFVNNALRGYVICHPWNSDKEVSLNYLIKEEDKGGWFYLHDLVIEEKMRREGYGRRMLRCAVELGEKEGFEKFMCVAVNPIGRKIAEEWGFKIDEEIDYNGIKAWRMKKLKHDTRNRKN